MRAMIEPLEQRMLLSQSLPVGAQLAWDNAPEHLRVGQRTSGIVVEMDDAELRRVNVSNVEVQFTVVVGPEVGQVIATANLERGIARVRGLLLTKAGGYTLLASAAGARAGQSGFTVEPGRGVAMSISGLGFDPLFPDQYNISVSIFDQYRNVATGDESFLRIGGVAPATNVVKFQTRDFYTTQPFPNIVQRNGRVLGARFQGGVDPLTLIYQGPPGNIKVLLRDSNPRIKPVLVPAFPLSS